jgi:quinol monooxygenase YgiN
MTTLLIEHRIDDYDAWRAVYDSVEPLRSQGGVSSHRVLRTGDDPNHVVVEHLFADADAAGAFVQSPALREAMGRAGVVADSLRALILEDAR